MSKQRELMEAIAQNVIAMMQEHGSDWTKPWRNAVGTTGEPISAKKRHYSGINRMNLGLVIAAKGFGSPVFATFKQWKSLGATIKKGSRGLPVIFYSPLKVTDKQTAKEKLIPMLKSYYVFNADQVDNWSGEWVTDQVEDPTQEWNDIVTADEIINQCGANIQHVRGDRAFYQRAQDVITIPLRAQFIDASGYYGTAFHEIIHWTGSRQRLDREKGSRFGNSKYAFEELIAELGSAMLSNIAKVDIDPAVGHAQYLNNWIACLSDHPSAILKAASSAQKASEYVLEAAKSPIEKAA